MAKRSITLVMAPWVVFSLLSGCAGVPRPNTDLCIINAPNGNRGCHNMAQDYDDNGNLLPGKPLVHKSNPTIWELNKFMCIDPDGLANLKAYLTKLRNRLANRLANCQSGQ